MCNWPSACRAVAFIAKAREILGFRDIVARELALMMDARVGPDDNNPWGLTIENDLAMRGVRPFVLEKEWGNIFGTDHAFWFRHIPFNQIALQLYWDVACCSLGAGMVVGVGFDYSVISGADEAAHVCRVVDILPRGVGEFAIEMVDDYNNGLNLSLESSRLEYAVRKVSGGFWLVGNARNMALDLPPPWLWNAKG